MTAKFAFLMTILLILVEISAAFAAPLGVDPLLQTYKKSGNLSGTLNSVGSDTMNNLMTYWGEGFRKFHPAVKVQVEGKGSGTAAPALISGTAQLGPMSRDMKKEEILLFEKKYGFKPTLIRTCLDGLAIFVNKDNPLKEIDLVRADAIFSKTRKRGFPHEILRWGGLGLKGDWEKRPIHLYGRNSASGTYGFFKEHVLDKGDFKDQVKEQPGSASVVQGVGEDRFAMGYSGIGYRTPGVRPLSLAEKGGAPAFEPTYENVLSQKYLLARYLNLSLMKDPSKPLSPLVREFVRFILSRQGQEIVIKDGYLPLTAKIAAFELEKLMDGKGEEKK